MRINTSETKSVGSRFLTPATISRLEDLQFHEPAVLNLAVLAVIWTVTVLVTFVDVMSGFQVELSKTTSVLLCVAIGEHFLSVFVFGAVVKTVAVQVLASNFAFVLRTSTSDHHLIGGSRYSRTEDIIVDEPECSRR